MATDFSIALADVQNIKTVELTGLGVIKVKKLDSSAGFTIKDGEFRMMKLSVQMNQLGKSIQELSAEEQEAQADSLVKSMDKPLEEIKAIREYEKQAYDVVGNGMSLLLVFNATSHTIDNPILSVQANVCNR